MPLAEGRTNGWTDGRTDGWTDGTEFIGPLLALLGIQECLQKSVRDFFLVCLDLELLITIKKHCFCECAETRSLFKLLKITQFLNYKKNPEHLFVDISKWKTCAKCQQKTFNSLVVGARQSYQSLRQNIWLLQKNLSNFFAWDFALLN